MADLIFIHKDKEYKATPITIGDWELLGNYLRSYLINDLKFVEDLESRFTSQAMIQIRDYDEFDVLRHLSRRDISLKLHQTMFKNDDKVTDSLIKEFVKDEGFIQFRRQWLIASGIIFRDEVETGNPPQDEA
jgi:hypothetical protein